MKYYLDTKAGTLVLRRQKQSFRRAAFAWFATGYGQRGIYCGLEKICREKWNRHNRVD
jgi:hypothetical protein